MTTDTLVAPHQLTYQGWSGFVVDSEDGPPLLFDPSPDVTLDTHPMVIAITHGHPEHVRGTLSHIGRTDRAPVAVVASRSVCQFLERRSACPGDRFFPVDVGAELDVDGWKFRIFAWRHMTLLPPGVWNSVRHLWKIFTHPIRLAGVGLQSLNGPRHAPMLGFHITAPGSPGPLAYIGEGLHRMTTRAELDAAFGGGRVHTLIAGVEPEDTEQIPVILAGQPIERVILFEPHRIWREQFGMQQADVPGLVRRLRESGFQSDAPAPVHASR